MKALNQGRQCMPGSVGRECIYEHFSPIYRQTRVQTSQAAQADRRVQNAGVAELNASLPRAPLRSSWFTDEVCTRTRPSQDLRCPRVGVTARRSQVSGLDRMSAGFEQHHRQSVGESDTQLSPGAHGQRRRGVTMRSIETRLAADVGLWCWRGAAQNLELRPSALRKHNSALESPRSTPTASWATD